MITDDLGDEVMVAPPAVDMQVGAEVALLPEAVELQDPAGRRVVREEGGGDTVEAETSESMVGAEGAGGGRHSPALLGGENPVADPAVGDAAVLDGTQGDLADETAVELDDQRHHIAAAGGGPDAGEECPPGGRRVGGLPAVVGGGLDGAEEGFVEKPRSEHWINGGFFCFEPAALDEIGEDSVLEREPLARLAASGNLRAHRHEGFWDCMDTYKDAVELNDLWASGEAPWLAPFDASDIDHPRVGSMSDANTGAPE